LSQHKFGELFGIKQKTLDNWEKGVGSPGCLTVYKIAKHFNLTMEELITGCPADKNGLLLEENKKLKELISQFYNLISHSSVSVLSENAKFINGSKKIIKGKKVQ